ncbi:MAG: hypothetical protein SGJ01_05810 [Gemmatimonadota bacterium]|nr:hypothetical protein [Gemmatimonadota bacterium]
MFIELTDHLRCPADHEESFLVLIPDEMAGRHVVRGTLGCPVCQREYPIEQQVVRLGEAAAPASPAAVGPDPGAAALLTLLGLEGPGGYLSLVGEVGRHAAEIAVLLPGIHLVLVNPPEGMGLMPGASLVHASRLPLKRRSLRGAVLGRPWAMHAGWTEAAVGAVLPGLRLVGTGPVPMGVAFELLGSADGWWVGRNG